MGTCRLLLLVMILGASISAQSPTYHLGRTPTAEEIRAWDIAISPTGKELPPGVEPPRKVRSSMCARGARHATGQLGPGARLRL